VGHVSGKSRWGGGGDFEKAEQVLCGLRGWAERLVVMTKDVNRMLLVLDFAHGALKCENCGRCELRRGWGCRGWCRELFSFPVLLCMYGGRAGMACGLAAGWQLPNQTGANHTRLLLGNSDSTPATQNTHRRDSINCMRVACSSGSRGTGVALQERSRISCCGTLIRTPVSCAL
jgi:hypothetical protein